MTDIPPSPDLDGVLRHVIVAEAASRAAMKEVWNARTRSKRMESALAVVLTSLAGLRGDSADYVLHRLSQELRRLAQVPDAAASLTGCLEADIDPELLEAIASRLSGRRWDDDRERLGGAWAVMQ